MTHDFDVEIITKLLFPPNKGFFGLFFANIQDFVGYFTVEVSSKGDYIFFVLLNNFFIDSGYVVESIGISNRRHFGQIVIPFFVFGQEHNLMPVVLYIFIGVVLTDKKFTTNNGCDFFFSRLLAIGYKLLVFGLYGFIVPHHFFHKVKGTHHIGVVGQRNGGHAMVGRGLYQIFNVDGGLKHRKL